MSQSASLNLHLHPKQGQAFDTVATEVLYGGAAGGGKSHLMRIAAIIWCAAIAGLQVYLFRRIRDDLVKNHLEGPKGLRALLAPWERAGFVKIVEDEIRFWNGSKIYLCHCKDEKDRFKYLGAEIHVLLIDELTTFTEVIYRFLRNRVRAVGLNLPPQYAGMFPRILCGSNPGNIGHHWVKQSFVDAPELQLRRMPNKEGGMLRQFIRAKLEDNPSMATDDPGYEGRLEGLGSEALVRAMRHGDWDIVEGAFFSRWRAERNIARPFLIPDHWLRFRSFDMGYATPFSCGWNAVASDDTDFLSITGRPLTLPRGGIVRYREWYGCKADEPRKGLERTAQQIATGWFEDDGARVPGILDRDAGETITYSVADPDAFKRKSGPSPAHEMAQLGVRFRKADNTRVPRRGHIGGWNMMRQRIDGESEDRPMLIVSEDCRDFIRTIPALQYDPDNPEDLAKSPDDHAADDCRYACMSRPWIKDKVGADPDRALSVGPGNTLTFDDAIAMARRERSREERI